MELLFSYASNLHMARLKSRLGEVEKVAIASIKGYTIDICVKSGDNSAKATMIETAKLDDEVWGIVTKHSMEQIYHLDKLEGHGLNYERKQLTVENENGRKLLVWAYLGKQNYFDHSMRPFEWYLQYIKDGAKNLNLPRDYRERFEKFESQIDDNVERRMMHLQILNN